MAKNPDTPKKPGKTPKSKAPSSKAARPDVQPIGPALAELLNPAINRGESGIGSSTGLQPPPDNSWDRRAGGEAAAHRARASTKGTSEDVAKRDAAVARSTSREPPHPTLPRKRERAPGGRRRALRKEILLALRSVIMLRDSPPSSPLPLAGEGQGGGASAESRPLRIPATRIRAGQLRHRRRRSRRSIRNSQSSSASPPRRKTPQHLRVLRATRWRRLGSPPPPTRWRR